MEVGGGGGVVVPRLSSDRDDQMGAKIKTPKNPCGLKQNPKKSLDQNLTPKNPMPNFRAIKNSKGTTRPGYAGTITNLQIVLNTRKIPT